MSENKRVFYAIEKAAIAPRGSTTFTSIRGLQNCNMTTNFNLQPVFEIGMISIYENIETIPTVEVTAQKLLDGYCPMFLLATQGAASPTLIARTSVDPCTMIFGVWPDTQSVASGTPVCYLNLSGLYINSVSYRLDTTSNAREDVTFTGNNKVWTIGNPTINDAAGPGANISLSNGNDQPLAIGGSGGVNRREHFILGYTANASRLPSQLPGVSSSGYVGLDAAGNYSCHLQSFAVSANFARDDIAELGRKGVFTKTPKLPIEVTCELVVHSTSGDVASMSEEGIYGTGYGKYNLINQTIFLRMAEGLALDLSDKNKCMSVAVGGGDTGGANQSSTYSFRNYNDLSVYHRNDVSSLGAPPGGW
jgi:hypothetical protein